MISITLIEYGGWPNCYRLSNDLVDIIITTDIGPRIIRFGFIGQENEFKEYAATLGQTGGNEWRIYGGHRLWAAPEDPARTYAPDNGPVIVERGDDFVRVTQPVDTAGFEKSIRVRLLGESSEARIVHSLRNAGASVVTAAPWAISVMAPGGHAIIPLPPRAAHGGNLLPTSAISLWAYTDMADPRWQWGEQRVTLAQRSDADGPQKAGFVIPDGWCAYRRGDHVFVKRIEYDPNARYPDFGSNVEAYTDAEMLELETLGPLQELRPGDSVEHTETWQLFDAAKDDMEARPV